MPPTWLHWPAAGGGTPWAPSDLTSLVGWWDADDGSTLYDATSGGNLVTTHNAQVKRWEDKSGNANHATQNDANGPKIQTTSNTLNSKPVMRFAAASNSMLVVAASSDFVADLLTVVAVIRTSSADTNRGLVGRWGTVGNYWLLRHRSFGSPNLPDAVIRNSANNANIAQAATTQVNDGNGRLLGSSMETGGDLRIFVDAVEEGTTSQTSNRSGTTEMYIGSFTNAGATNGLTGDIAELVMFRSAVDADRESAEGYLAHKWGITGVLDANHPYKTSPP